MQIRTPQYPICLILLFFTLLTACTGKSSDETISAELLGAAVVDYLSEYTTPSTELLILPIEAGAGADFSFEIWDCAPCLQEGYLQEAEAMLFDQYELFVVAKPLSKWESIPDCPFQTPGLYHQRLQITFSQGEWSFTPIGEG